MDTTYVIEGDKIDRQRLGELVEAVCTEAERLKQGSVCQKDALVRSCLAIQSGVAAQHPEMANALRSLATQAEQHAAGMDRSRELNEIAAQIRLAGI